MRQGLRSLWCWLTFRHRGEIKEDEAGIYWQCDNCGERSPYIGWDTVVATTLIRELRDE